MSNITRYDRACMNLGIKLYDPDLFKQDEKHDGKMRIGEAQIIYMLIRTQSMFEYKNLPETIPTRNLEIMLQLNGNVFFTKVNGEYYVFTGGLGGKPDVYYEPTIYTVANPALGISENYEIDKDGILIRSDSYGLGLLPMMQKYAALMVENEFTMRIADINSRISFLLSASDDRTKAAAELFLKRIIDGELGVLSDNSFLNDLTVHTTGDANKQRMTDLIEYQQYLKAAWFNDLGINANYNMKRESISPNEAQLNDDALLPLIDDMLESRKRAFKKINEMYGLDISVDLDSSWLKEQEKQNGSISPSGIGTDDASGDDVAIAPDGVSNDEMIEDETQDPENETQDPENETQEPENETQDPEYETQEPEDETQDPEDETQEPEDLQEIKNDIEDIKEDIQDIKEELSNEETD